MAATVLIVDDDERFRDLARRMLTTWGYQPESEAGTVTEALQRVAEMRPDVALVDIGLPDGTGLELSRVLAGAPWWVRVILVSSDSDATTTAEAAAAGARAFIPKTDLSGALLHSSLEDD
ncbi:response regulator [Micromonospora sp. DT81.3]|uniref:response regulator n=1 Tax=Micromonospora sp. DT81.3 TaxID=3416523 RepID=UPI003CF6F39C